MAVFVGTGKAGWEAAVRDGFDPSVSKLLAEKFVCLYVDSSTPRGKDLAAAFQVGNRGVVLSDRTGQTQAYSAAGTISRSELSRALVAYADVEVAQKTDAPKVSTGSSAGTVSGGAVITGPPGAMPGGVMVGPGGAMMAPPAGYAGGPMIGGPGYGGGCGQPAGGCGGGRGHGCCLFGGMMSGGCGHSGGCGGGGCGGGMGHGCGMMGGGWGGGGHGCCGLFGGMMGGWGGGCGGGMGHGCGGCH
jgi:hypothetical protein